MWWNCRRSGNLFLSSFVIYPPWWPDPGQVIFHQSPMPWPWSCSDMIDYVIILNHICLHRHNHHYMTLKTHDIDRAGSFSIGWSPFITVILHCVRFSWTLSGLWVHHPKQSTTTPPGSWRPFQKVQQQVLYIYHRGCPTMFSFMTI